MRVRLFCDAKTPPARASRDDFSSENYQQNILRSVRDKGINGEADYLKCF